PYTTWSGTVATGSQTFSGLTDIQTYNLDCKGPGGVLPTQTVKAWPPPRVSASGPASVDAGQSVTINWSVANATNCTFTGDWTDKSAVTYSGAPATGSRPNATSAGDAGSTKSYTITCSD